MQIKWHLFILLAIGFLIAQITMFTHLKITESQPDLLLILAVYLAIYAKTQQAFWAVAILGWCKDATNCERFGLFFFIFTFLAIMILYIRQNLMSEAWLFVSAITFFSALIANTMELILLCYMYSSIFLWQQCLLCAIYTMVVSVFLQILFYQIQLVRST